jgi:Holliday junction resolvase RusA-like endonuclease
MAEYRQVILGKTPSKSNCYRIITVRGNSTLGKTQALKAYENSFYLQCTLRGLMITKKFKLTVDVFYPSNRSDIDNSLKAILDCLQACKVIKNDNQCVEIHIRKFVDTKEPRIELTITELI